MLRRLMMKRDLVGGNVRLHNSIIDVGVESGVGREILDIRTAGNVTILDIATGTKNPRRGTIKKLGG